MQEFEQDVLFSFELDKDNIPDNVITGRLIVSNTSDIRLVFYENNFPDYEKMEGKKMFVVYGQTADGKKFTADNCFIQKLGGPKLIQNGLIISRVTILINRLFIGSWIPDIKTLMIDNIYVRLSYLEHWFRFFKIDYKPTSEKITDSIVIPVEQFKNDFIANIRGKFDIKFAYQWDTNTELNKKFTIDSRRYINLDYIEPVPIKEASKDVAIIHNLFQVLLVKERIFQEEVYFIQNKVQINIYQSRINYTPEKKSVWWGEYLTTFHHDVSKEMFINWFNLYQRYGRVFDTLFSVLDDQSSHYAENQFLSLIQWVEGFCRIKYPTPKHDKKEHSRKLKSIESKLTEDDLTYFKQITSYPYETNLSVQLKKLFRELELSDLLGANPENIEKFAEEIKDCRNKLTHIKEKSQCNLLPLVYQREFLRAFIYFILTKQLCIADEGPALLQVMRDMKFYYAAYMESSTKLVRDSSI